MTGQMLGKALSQDLDALVNHHLLPAQQILPQTEVCFILLKLTSELARGTMLFALQAKLDDKTPDEICNFVQKSIADLINGARPQVLAKYAELLAAHGSAG